MLNRVIDAFAQVRLGFVAAAAAAVLAAILAFADFTATPIGQIGTALDFSDPSTDLAALLVAALAMVLILWGIALGAHSMKTHHSTKSHSFRHFAR